MANVVISLSLIFQLYFAIFHCATASSSFGNSRGISCPNSGKSTKNFSIFMTFTVELEVHCLYQCMVESQCLSYNYGPKLTRPVMASLVS